MIHAPPSLATYVQNGAILAALLLASPNAAWTETYLGDEEAFLADIPTVFSATRLPQTVLSSPVSTTIITRAMIEASGLTQIPELLRLAPGFQVAQATSSNYVVSYHGQEITFPSRLEILVDGRSVYGNLFSNVNWKAIGIQLADIERIEVIRGPNAPVFGSNALVATINIETRQPYEQEGSWVNIEAGTQNYRKVLLRHAQNGPRWDYRISLGIESGSGFDFPEEAEPDYDDYELGDVSLRGAYTINAENQLDLQAGLTSGDPGTFHPGPEPFMVTHDSNLNAHYQFLRWTHSAAPDKELYVQFTHNSIDQTDSFGLLPLSDLLGVSAEQLAALGIANERIQYHYADGRSERYDIETQSRFSPVKNLRAVVGGGLRLDQLKSLPLLGFCEYTSNKSARLFTNLEWTILSQFSINAGVILEHNEFIDFSSSGRLAANYRFGQNQSLRAAASHTERSPSLLDERWNYDLSLSDGTVIDSIVSSPGNLASEKIRSYELGYALAIPQRQLHADIKYFYEAGYDLISFPRDKTLQDGLVKDGAEVLSNDDNYLLRGLEAELSLQPRSGHVVTLSYMRAKSRGEQYRVAGEAPFINDRATAKELLSLLVGHIFDNHMQLSGAYYFSDRIKWLGDGDSIGRKHRLDLRFAVPVKWQSAEGTLSLVAQNIGNDDQEYVQRNSFETRYIAKFELQL